jgi:hypothetical protein
MHPAVGMAFLINGEPYSSDRLDTQVQHFQSIGNYKAWNSALCSIFAITCSIRTLLIIIALIM